MKTDTDLGELYGPTFFRTVNIGSASSARVCAPLIIDLLHPSSLVDIGCGQGEWLNVFAELEVGDYHGIDGPQVADDQLVIPREHFTRHDLTRALNLGECFDVAMSLEVAEHLPAHAAADFVQSLVALAPAIVFSAAVPGQGGVHHINEQWPWYWKELFARRGYVQLDPFRQIIWKHPDVAVYYQHSLFLYVDPSVHKNLVERIGIPGRLQELTLIRTTILQELIEGGRVRKFLRRVGAKVAKVFRRTKV